jgi:hypothetical protein
VIYGVECVGGELRLDGCLASAGFVPSSRPAHSHLCSIRPHYHKIQEKEEALMILRKSSLSTRFAYAIALCLALVTGASTVSAQQFPQYDHVFLIIMENEDFSEVYNYPYAPILNAIAKDYGLATNYTGVGDPSEPNYVAMLGGSTFGISSDNPYFFPGQTVDADNLPSQLESAGKTWRGYFQSMPYAGYRGYCYPDKCNGIPDADTQYVSKHNGLVNFANLQTPSEFAKMMPLTQLGNDLANGTVPDFGYIVFNECNDMHGAPPWCVDSNNPAPCSRIGSSRKATRW